MAAGDNEPAETWTIYALTDPRDGSIRYVGRTTAALRKRLTGHLGDKGNARKREWVTELRRLGLKPRIKELASADTWEVAEKMEVEAILEIRRRGHRLFNDLARARNGNRPTPPSPITPENFEEKLAEFVARHKHKSAP